MRHHHHGHPFVRQFDHHVQHPLIISGRAEVGSSNNMAMGPCKAHGRWRHAAADRRKAPELVGMRRQANALQQSQAFIAGGGLIAFQHFSPAPASGFDDRQVGENSSKCWNNTPTRERSFARRFLSFTIMPLTVLRPLHRFQTIDGLNQRGFTGTRWSGRLPPPHLFHFC